MAFKSRQWLWKVAGLSVMGLLFVMQGAILTSVAGADSSEEIIRRVETLAYELDEGGVRIPGYGMSSEPGAPRLPVSTFAVE
ncbi:MAG: hypothetical protein U9R25_05255, partial [Chloroflexota bacterium]|nr:hypothetical protein [Chloroflexota bacterium]